ncbi:Speckle-type POZ protein B-like protein [Aphelenchoides besseyi]|nr:Speckle-type POZ protein B-like protein [Aphelenchoides besseyi]
MSSCEHNSHVQEFGWLIKKPKEFWQTNGQVEKLELLKLNNRPNTNVRAVIKSCGSTSTAEFSIEADDEFVDDLSCSIWLSYKGENRGSKDVFMELGTPVRLEPFCTLDNDNYIWCILSRCEICGVKEGHKHTKNQIVELMKEIEALKVSMNNKVQEMKETIANQTLKANNSEELWAMRNTNKLIDFALVVDGTKIKAHKNILASNSHFFFEQFDADPTKTEHVVEGTNVEAVKGMVEFVYLGSVEKFEEQVIELYRLSTKFSIPTLKAKCLELLKQPTSLENAAGLLILALENEDQSLEQVAIAYAEQNGGKGQLPLTNIFKTLIDKNLELFKKAMATLRS